MIILIHVIVALASIVSTTVALLFPSLTKLKISYGLVASTFASGILLAVTQPSHLLSICMTGLTYLGCMTIGIVVAHARLAHATNRS
jgi:hypothetical protein